jgi:hypothetical protein
LGASVPVVSRSTPDVPGKVHVVLTALPSIAQIDVDDAVVANPYIADPVRDDTPHRLRVEAPGYQPQTRLLAFGEDIDLEITLDPARSSPTSRRAAVQTTCQPPYVVDQETGKKRWRLECL